MKKKLLFPLLLLFVLALIFLSRPQKTELNKEILCTELKTQEQITVTIKGTYYQYALRDDHFVGLIKVGDLRECSRDYTLEHDERSYFENEYGMAFGLITQYDQFQHFSISENEYTVVSHP